MNAEVFIVVSMRIFVLSHQRYKPKTETISVAQFTERIHSTGTDPAMVQPYNDQHSNDEGFLNSIPEEPIEQSDNCFNNLSSFVAGTEGSMRFSAILTMGQSAIASSNQPIPCSDSNSNSTNMTSITNITSVENMGLVDGSRIVQGAMSLGGQKWCQ